MWPMLLDYTHDECKRILRKLELEAYASVISAFRAQGELSKDKKKMLQELSVALSISLERHRAEVRRAVNDERLHTIADRLAGPNTNTEWAIEGRRLVPLMPRLVPQTAFTAIANSAANAQAAKNAAMPIPSATGLKENGENEDAENERFKRKRASSLESGNAPQKIIALERTSPGPFAPSSCVFTSAVESLPGSMMPPTVTTSPCLPVVTRTVTLPVGPNPLKITLTTASHRPTSTMSISSATKQVILMSNSNATISSSVLQRPINVPVVKTVSTTASSNNSYQGKPLVSTSGVPALSSISYSVGTTSVPSYSEINMTPPSSILSQGPPYLSAAGGFTQTISTSTAPMSNTLGSRTRPKVSAVARLPLRPHSTSNSITTPPQMLNQQCLSPQLPTPSSLQSAARAQSPISKSLSPASRTPSPASVSHLPRSQSPASGQNVSRAQSPASATQSTPISAINPPTSLSPISANRSQSPVSAQVSLKTAVSPKSLNKGCSHKPQAASGARALLPTVSKTPLKNLPTTITNTQCQSHPSLQPSARNSVPTQVTLPIRASTPLIQTSKSMHSSGHVQLKSTNAPPRTIQYRNEGGLKIITQNFGNSRILPKPSTTTSAQALNSIPNKLTAATAGTSGKSFEGIASNARLINIQQPISPRVARAITPSSVASLGLPGLTTSALRVTLPAGTLGTPAVVKTNALGAKPNVIVVHKAQVWSQSQGATIVVSSSGAMSRIPPEAVQEAVSLITRQDRNRTSGAVTVVKSVPVSQNSTVIQNASAISASSAAVAGPSSDINPELIQSENSAENNASNFQDQEKPLELDSKNTILADLIQLAGIIPENSTPLIMEELPSDEIVLSQGNSELIENVVDKKIPEVGISESTTDDLNMLGGNPTGEEDKKSFSVSNLQVPKSEVQTAEQLAKDKFLPDRIKKCDAKDWAHQSRTEMKNPMKGEKVCVVGGIEDATSISIQDINLDQLPEGQILELQAQDAAELLSQHGQLSNEVLELLQQAGLQVEVQEELNTTNIEIPDPVNNSEELTETANNSSSKLNKKLETELDSQTGVLYVSENIKDGTVEPDSSAKKEAIGNSKSEEQSVSDIFSAALATAQLDLNTLQFVDDVMSGNNKTAFETSNTGNLKKN